MQRGPGRTRGLFQDLSRPGSLVVTSVCHLRDPACHRPCRRRGGPLPGLLAQIGRALAGRAGARLAAVLGIAVHRTTLLRLVTALPEPQISTAPEVLGVDDFALRKGHVYGTVLVNIATGKAIGVLPDREAGTLADWLKAHPGARVICRDRAGAYAERARPTSPQRDQSVARRHLWLTL